MPRCCSPRRRHPRGDEVRPAGPFPVRCRRHHRWTERRAPWSARNLCIHPSMHSSTLGRRLSIRCGWLRLPHQCGTTMRHRCRRLCRFYSDVKAKTVIIIN